MKENEIKLMELKEWAKDIKEEIENTKWYRFWVLHKLENKFLAISSVIEDLEYEIDEEEDAPKITIFKEKEEK